jgi:hypothetical protein
MSDFFCLVNWLRPFFVAASRKLIERVDQAQGRKTMPVVRLPAGHVDLRGGSKEALSPLSAL